MFEALSGHGVEYVVVDGMAAAIHSSQMATVNADVVGSRVPAASSPPASARRFDAIAAVSLALFEEGSGRSDRELLCIAQEHGTVDGKVETAKRKAMLAEILPYDPTARAGGREALDWFTAHGAANGYVVMSGNPPSAGGWSGPRGFVITT